MPLSTRIREHIRQNIWGILATYIALSGTAWAAAQVGANDIKNNAVRSEHIKGGEVKGSDVLASQVQKRVGATCPAGQAIRVIGEAGNVTCAGVGGGGSPTGPAGGDLAGNYPNPEIGPGKVGGPEVANNALTGADIQDFSIGAADIGELQINSDHLVNNAVSSSTVNDNSLTAADLATNSVGFSELAPNAVASSQIINGQVASPDVGDNSLTGADIQNESIGFTELGPNSVGDSEIADNEIKSPHVLNNSLTGADVSEASLSPLDATDYFSASCDPDSLTFIDCGPGLQFTAGQPMSVIAFWTYGFGTDGANHPAGRCRTTLDGADVSADIFLISNDTGDSFLGGVPIVDVIAVSSGTHTLGLRCSETNPDNSDLVVQELRIGVVELGFD